MEGTTYYKAVWYDEIGVPWVWGTAGNQATAEMMADIAADEYQLGRPDIHLTRRVTLESFADGPHIEVAEIERVG